MRDWKKSGNDEMVCYCKEVTKGEIVEAIRGGADSLKKIQKTTGACTGNKCAELNPTGKCCDKDIIELLRMEGFEETSGCSCCCDSDCC